MSVLTFDELTHRLENELHRLHYTEGSIAGYRRAWKHIASFLDTSPRYAKCFLQVSTHYAGTAIHFA